MIYGQTWLESDQKGHEIFNEFLYLKLNREPRPMRLRKNQNCYNPRRLTVHLTTEMCITGKNFTIPKFFNGNFLGFEKTDRLKSNESSFLIFRLAPHYYHRFHSLVDGSINQIKKIKRVLYCKSNVHSIRIGWIWRNYSKHYFH